MPTRRTGEERFHTGGAPLPFSVLSFWQWAASDLVSNSLRGVLAEFLVAQALGIADGIRVEWDACDLKTADGLRLEVKTAGYIQTWAQKALSAPTFDIGAKRTWDAEANTWSTAPSRSAEIYVFALHAHRDRATLDPLDLAQWEFYVLPTAVLDARCGTQKRINLAALLRLGPNRARFSDLPEAIRSAQGGSRSVV